MATAEAFKAIPIMVSVTPKLDLLRDIAITAAEGGINYWAFVVRWKWEGLPFPEMIIRDKDDNKKYTITPELICLGLQRVFEPGHVDRSSNTYTSAFSAVTQDDAGAIDSDAADNIIQLGIFGKIVYA